MNNTRGKAPSRSNLSTKQNDEKPLKLQIKQLQLEVQYLKNNSSNKENSNNQVALSIPTQHAKNKEMASCNIRSHQKNKKIISVTSFIEETKYENI